MSRPSARFLSQLAHDLRYTEKILFAVRGPFDHHMVEALINAIALAPEGATLVIDLFGTGTLHDDGIKLLRAALISRSGPVTFKHAGPWHRPLLLAIP